MADVWNSKSARKRVKKQNTFRCMQFAHTCTNKNYGHLPINWSARIKEEVSARKREKKRVYETFCSYRGGQNYRRQIVTTNYTCPCYQYGLIFCLNDTSNSHVRCTENFGASRFHFVWLDASFRNFKFWFCLKYSIACKQQNGG